MLRLGIIGTGAIATQFAKEANQNEHIALAGVVARNFEKTQAFAAEHQILKAFDSVETFLADETIDAVYVATLHPTHAAYSKQALLAGKHVLCEKPAAIKPWQIEELMTIAKTQNKLFMEAMTVGFHPLYQEIKKEIASGAIGTVTHDESTFGKMSKKEHKHTAELAGGCIYDIGIYNLYLILDLLGMPTRMQAQVRQHRTWDVPGTVQLLAEHESGAQSYSFMTMDALSTTQANILGTEGTITIPKGWTVPTSYTVETVDGTVREATLPREKWLGYELEAFYQTIQNGQIENPTMTWEKSLQLQQMIDALYSKLDIVVPDEAIFM